RRRDEQPRLRRLGARAVVVERQPGGLVLSGDHLRPLVDEQTASRACRIRGNCVMSGVEQAFAVDRKSRVELGGEPALACPEGQLDGGESRVASAEDVGEESRLLPGEQLVADSRNTVEPVL